MSEFTGKTALVTGAASGIGAACARWLSAQGIGRLIVVDRDGERLARLELDCERVAGDVADEALWERLEPEIATLHYAVLNAGIAAGGPIAETSFAEWRKTIGVNLDGMFLSLRTAMRRMTEGGAIVLTASAAGLKTEPGNGPYGVSKAGVIHLAKAAAKESAAKGIRVNAGIAAGSTRRSGTISISSKASSPGPAAARRRSPRWARERLRWAALPAPTRWPRRSDSC